MARIKVKNAEAEFSDAVLLILAGAACVVVGVVVTLVVKNPGPAIEGAKKGAEKLAQAAPILLG